MWRHGSLVLWRSARHLTHLQCCLLMYTLGDNGDSMAECFLTRSRLIKSKKLLPGPRKLLLQWQQFSPVLILSQCSAGRKRCAHISRAFAAPSGYSESHLAQSGGGGNPLGHVVQLLGAKVSVEGVFLPFKFHLLLLLHIQCSSPSRVEPLIKPETHEMEKPGPQ